MADRTAETGSEDEPTLEHALFDEALFDEFIAPYATLIDEHEPEAA